MAFIQEGRLRGNLWWIDFGNWIRWYRVSTNIRFNILLTSSFIAKTDHSFLVKVVNPLDESEAIMCNIYTWFYLPKWYTARSSMQVVVCVTMYGLYKTVSGKMLYQQRHTQSNPLNERWRQTISRWRFVYCVQWNKTAHSLTPEIIIGVDVLHRWKVKVNSIINYLDYNKAMNIYLV